MVDAYYWTAICVLTLLLVVSEVGHLRRLYRHWRGKCPTPYTMIRDSAICTTLIEMRVVLNCDRVFIFRFHNGEEFSPSEDIWKMTCTHEIVRPGVTYESSKVHGLIFSKVSKLIAPVFTGQSTCSGVHKVGKCSVCMQKDDCARNHRNVICVQVGGVPSSYERFFLEEQNVKTAIFAGLVKNGNVFGIVGAHFTGDEVSGDQLDRAIDMVCSSSSAIQHIINGK